MALVRVIGNILTGSGEAEVNEILGCMDYGLVDAEVCH